MQLVVGISDMKFSNNQDDVIVTYSLGSCLGVTAYDPVLNIGGMIHCMLPLSKSDKEKAKQKPYMYVDTGVSNLLHTLYQYGSKKTNLIIKLAGCAQIMDDKGLFKIGERNHTVARKILWKNDILIASEDVGSTKSRTMFLELSSGNTYIKTGGVKDVL